MNCSLIICTYNWPEALELVLTSITLQSVAPGEIIVADDGSGESTAKVVQDFAKRTSIPLIHSWQKDDGCRIPHSRNRAIAKSSFEYIIMIDGDTILHRDFVKDHVRFARKKIYNQGSRVLLQSRQTSYILSNNIFKKPLFFSNDSKNKINMLRVPLISKLMSYYKSKNINRIRGCNYSIFKEDILDVNGFNEEMTIWGREDSEFVQRLFNNGVKKRHLKFAAIQYHLYHQERSHNIINDTILKNTIFNNLIWCESGIDRYSSNE